MANPVLDKGLEWLSRTIAILIVMIGPGLLGSFLDARFGLRFLTPTGLVLGMLLGTFVLLLLVRKLAPPARGTPLSDDEDRGREEAFEEE